MLRYFLTNLILSSIVLLPIGPANESAPSVLRLNQLPLSAPASVAVVPKKIKPENLGVKLASASAVVLDQGSGQFLYQKNSNELLPLASITKLMTAMVWLEQKIDPNQELEILATDAREGGVAYLVPGEKILLKDLLAASLIASANDATASLVRSTGLTEVEFVAKMNNKAKELGLSQTYFTEPIGLNDKTVSTAREVSILALAAFGRAEIKNLVSRAEYEFKPSGKTARWLKNTNLLLGGFEGWPQELRVVGGKTGHLLEVGYNVVSAIANQKGQQLIIVVLGAQTAEARFQESKVLAYWTFNNYNWD
ncbi:MAG: serine hydrolase [Candidatus Buchananbacteria bacterium]